MLSLLHNVKANHIKFQAVLKMKPIRSSRSFLHPKSEVGTWIVQCKWSTETKNKH